RTTAERAALGEDGRAAGAMNGPVHSPTAEQRLVGGVDDGVHFLPRDVAESALNARAVKRTAAIHVFGGPYTVSNTTSTMVSAAPGRASAREASSMAARRFSSVNSVRTSVNRRTGSHSASWMSTPAPASTKALAFSV